MLAPTQWWKLHADIFRYPKYCCAEARRKFRHTVLEPNLGPSKTEVSLYFCRRYVSNLY